MRFAASVSALAFAAMAFAQDTTIKVGEVAGTMELKFSPASVNITTPGSVVTFVFDGVPGNHTVAQSSFASPCEPLDGGFNSGFVFTNASTSAFQWNLTVTDVTKPIWFYCAQQKPVVHCTQGMVGAINAPATGNTFDAFQSLALAASASVAFPTTTAASFSGALAFATETPVSSGTVLIASSSGSASNGTSSTSGSSPASTSNAAAGIVSSNGFVAFLAAAFGVALL